ncbi:hypothetical protein NJB95_08895 [Brucella intermedia]|uniref:hypothetical protein n=1 Tax=Brucella intermedia TaxID=94625 RepID=UPI00209B0E53|nr:hypothetical protein [Brucella intermedia]MCO7736733.1 hypothetical protein [Brucella intermedia]WLF99395.1 hypothetical protein Q5698_16960 [Brucella intermedia]
MRTVLRELRPRNVVRFISVQIAYIAFNALYAFNDRAEFSDSDSVDDCIAHNDALTSLRWRLGEATLRALQLAKNKSSGETSASLMMMGQCRSGIPMLGHLYTASFLILPLLASAITAAPPANSMICVTECFVAMQYSYWILNPITRPENSNSDFIS